MPHSPHRVGFVTTTALAACMAVLLLGLSGAVGYLVAPCSEPLLASVGLLASASLAVLASVPALATLGGLVVLSRDGRESRGVPYVDVNEPERAIGSLASALRRAWFPNARLLPGELAEVRSWPEIAATLDERGCLDGLPFMPEMAAYCGHRFPVHRRVHKVWEYANATGLRRFHDAVLLRTLRCDGGSHGGCESACQLIWKEAWLKRPGAPVRPVSQSARPLDLATHTQTVQANGTRYVCQMTEIVRAAGRPIPAWSLGHHFRDWLCGNARLTRLTALVGVRLFNSLQRRLKRPAWPVLQPTDSDSSPHLDSGLQPGQLVQIKRKRDIELTLNRKLRNRGMEFSRDMLSWCGGSARVRARIHRIVHEGTGEMLELKTPSILLEGVTSDGGTFFCPQNEFYFWREIWLEAAPPARQDAAVQRLEGRPPL